MDRGNGKCFGLWSLKARRPNYWSPGRELVRLLMCVCERERWRRVLSPRWALCGVKELWSGNVGLRISLCLSHMCAHVYVWCVRSNFQNLGDGLHIMDRKVGPWKMACSHGSTSWSNFHGLVSSKKLIYEAFGPLTRCKTNGDQEEWPQTKMWMCVFLKNICPKRAILNEQNSSLTILLSPIEIVSKERTKEGGKLQEKTNKITPTKGRRDIIQLLSWLKTYVWVACGRVWILRTNAIRTCVWEEIRPCL